MGSHILAAVFGYLLGSVPTAFLVVLWKSKIDIRAAGSGNVGTFNSYFVTRSKFVAGLVLLVDALKGFLAVFGARLMFGEEFSVTAVSGVSAVLGHNYPVWLGFRGGRGLAPGAGAMLAISWGVVGVWLLLWSGAYLLLRDINPANALACVIVVVLLFAVTPPILQAVLPPLATPGSFQVFCVILFGIILSRHLQPVGEYFVNLRKRKD